jgi:hypothetical protein
VTDLYVHTDSLSSADTLAQLSSLLEEYEGVMRLIKEGIHSEKTAPAYVEDSW